MKNGGKSKLSSLQTKLAEVLEVEEDRVAIFSVHQVVTNPPLTDIRFSVTNFRREVLDGLLMLHTDTVSYIVSYFIQLLNTLLPIYYYKCLVRGLNWLVTT